MTEMVVVASVAADALRLVGMAAVYAAVLVFWYLMISRLGSF